MESSAGRRMTSRSTPKRALAVPPTLIKLSLGDAQEGKQGPQVWLDVVQVRLGSAFVVDAAGRHQEGSCLIEQESRRSAVLVRECLAGARHLVDPQLENRRNREIVHGDAEHIFIGGFQFGDQRTGKRQDLALTGSQVRLRRVGGGDPLGIDGRNSGGGKIADNQFAIRVDSLPFLDKLIGQVAAEGNTAAQGAGIDSKKGGHVSFSPLRHLMVKQQVSIQEKSTCVAYATNVRESAKLEVMAAIQEAGETLDPRVRRTRQLLQEALRKLLKIKEFDKISVQDISDAATVNRATFYDHYDDKFGLLECMVG